MAMGEYNRVFPPIWDIAELTHYLRKLRAKLWQRRFERIVKGMGNGLYCKALTGESSYNICINSDLSVSCNCQDFDGSGQIGNLSTHTLQEIWSGPVAARFRRKLANGEIPTWTCSRCYELRCVSMEEALCKEVQYSLPTKGIMVENAPACCLRCIDCARQALRRTRDDVALGLEGIKRVSSEVKANGIGAMSYFNLNEPFMSSTVLEELQILRADNPDLYIATSTNGLLLSNEVKRDAAMLLNQVVFSLDGITDRMVRKYQRGGSFQRAYSNMRELVAHRNDRGLVRPRIEWKYVLFRWNDRRDIVLRAIDLAREAGVEAISFLPTTWPPYGASWRYYRRDKDFYESLGKWGGNGIQVDLQSAAEKSVADEEQNRLATHTKA